MEQQTTTTKGHRMNQRSDIHRPSITDPAEYRCIAEGDRGGQDEPGFHLWINGEADAQLAGGAIEGNFETRGRCDHCGAGPLRYYACFVHEPSGDVITVGDKCASDLELSSRSECERKAARIRNRTEAQKQVSILANPAIPEAVEFLQARVTEGDYGYEGMYHSMIHRWNRWGNLSEKQVAAALRAKTRQAEFEARREAERENDRPVVEGRVQVEGTILSTKWQENDFGGSLKMLVRDDRGFKVWGSVPDSLSLRDIGRDENGKLVITDEFTGCQRSVGKGDRVRFTGTITKSDRDECFGFFKRPTKAEVLELAEQADEAPAPAEQAA